MKEKINSLETLLEERKRIKLRLGIIEDELFNKFQEGKSQVMKIGSPFKWFSYLGKTFNFTNRKPTLTKTLAATTVAIAPKLVRRPFRWSLIGVLAKAAVPILLPIIQDKLLGATEERVEIPEHKMVGKTVSIGEDNILAQKYSANKQMVEHF